jgi:hypothetical protein
VAQQDVLGDLYRPIVVLELNHWCLNAFQRTSLPDFFDYLRSVFPVLLGSRWQSNYLNLHDDSNDTYIVMYHHISAHENSRIS